VALRPPRAFGSTAAPRRGRRRYQLQQLVASGAPVITIFGKSWDLHAREILRCSLEENLAMIEDSVAFLKSRAAPSSSTPSISSTLPRRRRLRAGDAPRAQDGGADACPVRHQWRMLPPPQRDDATVAAEFPGVLVAIHCHNDGGLADANSSRGGGRGAAGPGTINGYGERSGNANLCTLLPNLELKMARPASRRQAGRPHLRVALRKRAGQSPAQHPPAFVGRSAFATRAACTSTR